MASGKEDPQKPAGYSNPAAGKADCLRLYERHGFTECEPFDTYVADPHSRSHTLDLSGGPG